MRRTRRGGAATAMPLDYFGIPTLSSLQGPGSNLLATRGSLIRPAIGGKRVTKRTHRRRIRGGFYPSVMGNFIAVASKYITPIALFAGYKLMTRKTKKHRR